MKRDIAAMAKKTFDLLVIGGGISGAAIAHEASLRGFSTALLEKSDFGGETSAATSKLVHGGLRYLKNVEFGLVRESLRERRIFEYIAPHMVAPLPFMIPTYRWTQTNMPMMWAAMFLYDKLSFDKARLDDLDLKIPRWRRFDRKETLVLEDGLKSEGLSGSVLYYDCQMWTPERLTLEFIRGAAENGACVANYAKVQSLLRENKAVAGVAVKDLVEGKEYEIRSRMTINAAGPWADYVSGMVGERTKEHIVRSEGIHLVTRPLTRGHAVVLSTPAGRLFFIIPWRGLSLIGTTDTRFEGDPDNYRLSRNSVENFIDEINGACPSANLTLKDVQWAYGGLRPIVETDTEVEDINKASRRYEIHDHKKDGVQGFITVIGGKYTTSRSLAETIIKTAARNLNLPLPPKVSHAYVLPGGRMGSLRGFQTRLMRNLGVHSDEAVLWTKTYGAHAYGLLEAGKADKNLAERIDENHFETMAVVDMAVNEEMAQTLDDVVFRRTGLGTTGRLSDKAVRKIADRTASLLGWPKKKAKEQADATIARIRSANIP